MLWPSWLDFDLKGALFFYDQLIINTEIYLKACIYGEEKVVHQDSSICPLQRYCTCLTHATFIFESLRSAGVVCLDWSLDWSAWTSLSTDLLEWSAWTGTRIDSRSGQLDWFAGMVRGLFSKLITILVCWGLRIGSPNWSLDRSHNYSSTSLSNGLITGLMDWWAVTCSSLFWTVELDIRTRTLLISQLDSWLVGWSGNKAPHQSNSTSADRTSVALMLNTYHQLDWPFGW